MNFPKHIEHKNKIYDFDTIGGTGEPIYKNDSGESGVKYVIAIYPEIANNFKKR